MPHPASVRARPPGIPSFHTSTFGLQEAPPYQMPLKQAPTPHTARPHATSV